MIPHTDIHPAAKSTMVVVLCYLNILSFLNFFTSNVVPVVCFCNYQFFDYFSSVSQQHSHQRILYTMQSGTTKIISIPVCNNNACNRKCWSYPSGTKLVDYIFSLCSLYTNCKIVRHMWHSIQTEKFPISTFIWVSIVKFVL